MLELTGNKRLYIVNRVEEELGHSPITVIAPKSESKETVMQNLAMASNYAQTEYDEDTIYDEHKDEMSAFRETCNGDEAFIYYLKTFCHYDVSYTNIDYTFVW